MKLSDLLKKLFGDKFDEDIDIDKEDNTPPKEDEQGNEEDGKGEEKEDQKEEEKTSKDEEDKTDEKEEVTDEKEEIDITDDGEELKTKPYIDIFNEAWFSSEGCQLSLDFKNIKGEEIKLLIEFLYLMYEFKMDLKEYLSNLSLSVSEEFLLQQLNFTEVDIRSGSNKDVIEKAINNLREKEPGLFTKSPIDEGFDPVNKSKTTTPNSFTEAFQLME